MGSELFRAQEIAFGRFGTVDLEQFVAQPETNFDWNQWPGEERLRRGQIDGKRERQALQFTAGEVPLVRSPIRMDGAREPEAPPLLGQHTREVLAELGVSETELRDLAARGAIEANKT